MSLLLLCYTYKGKNKNKTWFSRLKATQLSTKDQNQILIIEHNMLLAKDQNLQNPPN